MKISKIPTAVVSALIICASALAVTPCGYPKDPVTGGGGICQKTWTSPFTWSYDCTQTHETTVGGCVGSGNTQDCIPVTKNKLFNHWESKAANSSCYDAGGCQINGNELVTYHDHTTTGACIKEAGPVEPVPGDPTGPQ